MFVAQLDLDVQITVTKETVIITCPDQEDLAFFGERHPTTGRIFSWAMSGIDNPPRRRVAMLLENVGNQYLAGQA